MYTEIELTTSPGENLINITEKIRQVVRDSNIQEGLCVLFVPHTTAGITINSAMDVATLKDIVSEMHRLIPTRVDFHHNYDTPADAAGHIKSTLVGNNVSLLVVGGELLLGNSQSVLFFEFDGPRSRHVFVSVLPDSR